METREEVKTGRSVVGQPRNAGEMTTRQDPWAEADFYGADAVGDKVINLEEGDAICAVFHGVRTAKNQYSSLYLVLEAEDGRKIRLFAPRHLAGQFVDLDAYDQGQMISKIAVGTYVELTYRGLKANPNGGKDYKHFDVLIPKEANL